ncbi:MAG: type IVB secretion system apparatus protein IcmL/DotI [Gammaproteobacteria bacterium]|nr:type IVB secretion system apparatus protein IcmL/DotI [Gammaproteobacteria bacterium]
MAEDVLTQVVMRNEFYRIGHRRTLTLLFVSGCMNALLIFVFLDMFMHPPQPRYFATSIGGQIAPQFPLNVPNQSDEAISKWASQAAMAAFTYNFVNYKDELQASSGFFTAEGWTRFLDALKASNNLDAIRDKKLVVSAVATSSPKIVQKGVLDGQYSWRVEVPILVTYQSVGEYSQANNIVKMLISRVSSLNSPRGVGIAQFVVEPVG